MPKHPEETDDAAGLLRGFAHDFSSPLSTIKLAAEVLIATGGEVPADKVVELGHTVSSEADRVRHMIDTLVEFSRLATGQRELVHQWHLAEDVVGSAIRRLGSLLDEHDVVVTIDRDLAFLRGDDVLIETVLAQMLDNAAHYTPANQSVAVRVSADDQGCTVEVIDEGPGLDDGSRRPADADSSKRAGHSSPPGGALGMAVSRQIIDAHDGEFWSRNRQDTTGAVFAVTLGYGGEAPPQDDF